MRQAITWTNDDPVHWCIYAALGGDELMSLFSLDIRWHVSHVTINYINYIVFIILLHIDHNELQEEKKYKINRKMLGQ